LIYIIVIYGFPIKNSCIGVAESFDDYAQNDYIDCDYADF